VNIFGTESSRSLAFGLVMMAKPSAFAKCHNATFVPSLLATAMLDEHEKLLSQY